MKRLLIAVGSLSQLAMFAQEAGENRPLAYSAPWYDILWQLVVLEWQKCCLAVALIALVIVFFGLNAKKKAQAKAAAQNAATANPEPQNTDSDKQE